MKKFILFIITAIILAVGCTNSPLIKKNTPQSIFEDYMSNIKDNVCYQLHEVSYELKEYRVDSVFNTPYNIYNYEKIGCLCDSINYFIWATTFHEHYEKEWSSWLMYNEKHIKEHRNEKFRTRDSLLVYLPRLKDACNDCDNSFIGYVLKYRYTFTDNGETNIYTAVCITDENMNPNIMEGQYVGCVDDYNEYFAEGGEYDREIKSLCSYKDIDELIKYSPEKYSRY